VAASQNKYTRTQHWHKHGPVAGTLATPDLPAPTTPNIPPHLHLHLPTPPFSARLTV